MTCARCQAVVPDESAFCLRCGARLGPPERPVAANGGKPPARPPSPSARPVPAAVGPTPAKRDGKQAYTLGFKAVRDERLRYRVARWVCEVAPAHPIAEVQEGLSRGEFATFLALTAEEADATRQRIQALGLHPALWHLRPAKAAEMVGSERPGRREAEKSEWSPQRKIAAVAIGLIALFLFGIVSLSMYRSATSTPPQQPGKPPAIGGRP